MCNIEWKICETYIPIPTLNILGTCLYVRDNSLFMLITF